MKKYVISFVIITALAFIFAPLAFADHPPYMVDNAHILTDSDRNELNYLMREISERRQCTVAVVTVRSIGTSTPRNFAENYFAEHGYGYGENADGVLLLVSMESRDWYITTHGMGNDAYTVSGIGYVGHEIKGNLSNMHYADAFRTFARESDRFIGGAIAGRPYDRAKLITIKMWWKILLVSAVCGVFLALKTVQGMKDKLHSVRQNADASNYVKLCSTDLTESRDIFLYKTLDSEYCPNPIDTSSGSGGGGGFGGGTFGGGGFGGGGGKF